jgi:putative hydrolase of the HAD superfamily
MPFTAVLFDLDETLLADIASTDQALEEASVLAEERSAIDSRKLVESVKQHAHQLWHASPLYPYCDSIGISSGEGLWGRFGGDDPNLQALAAWAPTYQLEAWKLALADQDSTDEQLASDLMRAFQRRRREIFRLFPETESVLRDLKGHYQLAIITNGAPDVQRDKIAGAQLGDYFDAIVVSGEVGVGKPDARVFQRALDLLDVTPDRALVVGDNLICDIQGAQSMGICGAWINRDGTSPARSGVLPNHIISSLQEVTRIVTR